MKRMAVFLMLVCMLTGCGNSNPEMEKVLDLRQKLLSANQCRFETEVTADYGDKLFVYTASCIMDGNGDLTVTVTSPESIQDITLSISDDGGRIVFAEQALHFPLLAEDALSPVSAPWIVMKTLRSGYLTSVCTEDGGMHLTIHDGYSEDALMADIRLDGNDCPFRADILHEGVRILSLTIRDFQIL